VSWLGSRPFSCATFRATGVTWALRCASIAVAARGTAAAGAGSDARGEAVGGGLAGLAPPGWNHPHTPPHPASRPLSREDLVQGSGLGGGDIDGDLVGLQDDQGLVHLNGLTRLLVPLAHHRLGDGLPQRGYGQVNWHASPRASALAGRAASARVRAPA